MTLSSWRNHQPTCAQLPRTVEPARSPAGRVIVTAVVDAPTASQRKKDVSAPCERRCRSASLLSIVSFIVVPLGLLVGSAAANVKEVALVAVMSRRPSESTVTLQPRWRPSTTTPSFGAMFGHAATINTVSPCGVLASTALAAASLRRIVVDCRNVSTANGALDAFSTAGSVA